MHYRKLGSSDLEVSEISLGSWLTYGVGVEADQARACLDEAFAQGINFIDTANVYGRGAAERFLGEALKARARDSYVLATKLFFPMSDSDRGLSAAQVEKQLDASLGRLKTDHVDLYQCHRYDFATPLEETMAALTRAVASGKVRYIGFSEWDAHQIQAALDLTGAEATLIFGAAAAGVVAGVGLAASAGCANRLAGASTLAVAVSITIRWRWLGWPSVQLSIDIGK